ncbi:unnamed protein product [Orchesella dallaii]|uniref:Malonyl-CoA:ACP transacylase (MAT) domain-containing protein n=1 Tax=Orchesella dallaii TaxID=48710 RepID=A0ABP1S1Z1_9HEXA
MKIRGSNEYAWATILESQEDAEKALVLAASLRRVLTSNSVIALLKGNEFSKTIRNQLIAGGFDDVLTIPKENTSYKDIFETEGLKSFKKLVYLPVDSIVLKNCDSIVDNDRFGRTIDLRDKDDAVVVCTTTESKAQLLEDSIYYSIDYTDAEANKECLDSTPGIVQLKGITTKNSSEVSLLNATTGLLEKKILNYWQEVFRTDVLPILDDTTESSGDQVWDCEPVAVIGMAESCQSFTEALDKAFAEAAMSSKVLSAESRPTIFISSKNQDSNELTKLLKSSMSSVKTLSHVEWISSERNSSSITALHSAMEVLVQRKSNLCLVYFNDGRESSLLILQRLSHAIEHSAKIHAILGKPKGLSETTDETPVEVSDIVEIVLFVNLRGPMLNKPWLNFIKINPKDTKEVAVVNGHLVISDGHQAIASTYPQIKLDLSRPLHAIALQAPTSEKLDEIIENCKSFLAHQGQPTYADTKAFANLAYTINTKCDRFQSTLSQSSAQHRAMLIPKDCAEACKLLSTKGYLREKCSTENNGSGKLCFLFTGQGSQYPGMAKTLYENCPIFRISFDRCNQIFLNMYNINIHDVIWKNSQELSRTLFSQTAIFCVEYALLQVWKSWGLTPDYVIGHSLGEFAAAVACGALDLADALKLVAERSRLIDELPRGKMLVLRGDEQSVGQLLQDFSRNNPGAWLDYAAINSKDQTVLSGDSRYVEEFAEFCLTKKVKSIVLEATHAFHSRHMDPMLEKYRRVAETCKGSLMPTKCKYISGMDGKRIDDPLDPTYWVRHTRERVRFVAASKVAYEEGCRVFLEVGPQPILSALAKVNTSVDTSLVFLPSIRRGVDDWKTILNSLAKLWLEGRWVDWRGFEKYFERAFIPDTIIKEIISY